MSQFILKKGYFENLRCPSCIMNNAAQICRYQGMPWVDFSNRSYLTDYDNVYEGLSAELEDFYQFIRPKAEDDTLRKATFLCIAKSIKKSVKFDIESVKYYGSFSSNTYLPVSDIDIVVTVPKELNTVSVLFEIAHLLFIDGIIEKHCSIIPHSRIPLLKFYDCMTGFQINITVNTPNVMERAEYIRFSFFHKLINPKNKNVSHVVFTPNGKQWPMYELKILYFMKYYLLYRGSNQVYLGGIGSYALSLMVLRYFQEKETAEMIATAERNGLNGGTVSKSSLLGHLLISFLQRYSDVDFISKVIISVRDGGAYIASTSNSTGDDSIGGGCTELNNTNNNGLNSSGVSGGGKNNSHFAGHYLNKKTSVLNIEDPREPWKNVAAGSFNSDIILADFGRLLHTLLHPKEASAGTNAGGVGPLHRLYAENENQWSIIANGLTVVDSFVEFRAILKDIHSFWFPYNVKSSPKPLLNERYENFMTKRNIFGKRRIEFEYKRFEDNTAQLVLIDQLVPRGLPPLNHNNNNTYHGHSQGGQGNNGHHYHNQQHHQANYHQQQSKPMKNNHSNYNYGARYYSHYNGSGGGGHFESRNNTSGSLSFHGNHSYTSYHFPDNHGRGGANGGSAGDHFVHSSGGDSKLKTRELKKIHNGGGGPRQQNEHSHQQQHYSADSSKSKTRELKKILKIDSQQ